jgi:hypothetical protein
LAKGIAILPIGHDQRGLDPSKQDIVMVPKEVRPLFRRRKRHEGRDGARQDTAEKCIEEMRRVLQNDEHDIEAPDALAREQICILPTAPIESSKRDFFDCTIGKESAKHVLGPRFGHQFQPGSKVLYGALLCTVVTDT